MILNDILLYSEIGALPSYHQKSVLLQKMGTNIQTHSLHDTEGETLQHEISIKSLSSELRETLGRRS